MFGGNVERDDLKFFEAHIEMLSESVAKKAKHQINSNFASHEDIVLYISWILNNLAKTRPGDLPALKFNETIKGEELSSGGLP